MIRTYHTVEPADSGRYRCHNLDTGSPILRTAERAGHEMSSRTFALSLLHIFRVSFQKYLFKDTKR